jgi:hypothetical protein
MRHLHTLLIFFCLTAPLIAQQSAPQQGKFKSLDAESGLVTITTAAGVDVECSIVPQTMFRDGNGQPIADFQKKGLAAGTPVMFMSRTRDGKNVLVGLKLAGQSGGNRPDVPPPRPPRDSIGVKPLTELGNELYKGEVGGLYGNGSNEPPVALQNAAKLAASRIVPLDAKGEPSSDGKIGLLGIGMSNTTQEFSTFKKLADVDPARSPNVSIVDVAQGGKASEQWIDPKSEVGKQVWETVTQRLNAAKVSDQQVQVVWIKQAIMGQARFGEFPAHAKKLESDLVTTLQLLKTRFPNLQIAYLSSRIYAGYATTSLNPEPYAFEGAFSIRWIINSQLSGDAKLNADPSKGQVNAPVVLWGPYLWGDGKTPRADGLVWNRDDLVERDGTHPSDSGRRKVADMLMKFFHSDPFASGWYLKKELSR